MSLVALLKELILVMLEIGVALNVVRLRTESVLASDCGSFLLEEKCLFCSVLDVLRRVL